MSKALTLTAQQNAQAVANRDEIEGMTPAQQKKVFGYMQKIAAASGEIERLSKKEVSLKKKIKELDLVQELELTRKTRKELTKIHKETAVAYNALKDMFDPETKPAKLTAADQRKLSEVANG